MYSVILNVCFMERNILLFLVSLMGFLVMCMFLLRYFL